MFSVDNFYDFLDSHYGWAQTQSMLWRFFPHGSKNLFDLQPYYDFEKFKLDWFSWNMGGVIILHDQEPLNLDLLATYKKFRYDLKKDPLWLDHTHEELLLMHTRSIEWPVLCHSELNSQEVRYLENLGLIACYYLYHGLVARDWFRHWRHHHWVPNHQQRFLLYAREFTGSRKYRQDVVELLSPFREQIRYNWQGDDSVPSDYSAKIVVEDAVTTAVHLVAETLFDTEKIHITEKCFKPMVMRQPFLMFASPGTLSVLRDYGFRTFADVWDESYDLERDHKKRLHKVVGQIEKLNSLNERDFQSVLYRCQSAIEHNHRHFYSDKFEKIMLDELHANMDWAIKEQKSRIDQDPGGSFYHMVNLVLKRGITPSRLITEWSEGMTQYMSEKMPERFVRLQQQYPWASQYL